MKYNNINRNKQRMPAWYTIFMKNSGGFSSKRILAILGILLSFILLTAAFIQSKEVPEFGEVIFIGCISLYGVDVIPNFWTKTINKS